MFIYLSIYLSDVMSPFTWEKIFSLINLLVARVHMYVKEEKKKEILTQNRLYFFQ